MNTINNGSIKKGCFISFKLVGIISSFFISQPTIASGIDIYKENNKIYYTPFSKTCTDPEVKQFITKFLEKEFLIEENSLYPLDVSKDKDVEDALKEKEYELRIIACGETAVPEIINLLQSNDRKKIKIAISLLTKIGKEAEKAVPFLVDFLRNSDDDDIKESCVNIITTIGPAAKDAVPILIALVRNSAEDSKINNYIKALAGIGPLAKDAIPELVSLYKNGNFLALAALTEIGEDGIVAIINLILNDRTLAENTIDAGFSAIRNKVADSNIPYNKVIQPINHLLRDKSRRKYTSVLIAILAYIGEKSIVAASLVDDFVKHNQSENINLIDISAIDALRRTGRSKIIVPLLIKIINSGDSEAINVAIEILGSIDADASSAIPVLTDALRSGKERAATALSRIGIPAVPYLISLLADDTDKAARSQAALALGEIGPTANAAIPYLRPLLHQDKKSQLLGAIALAEIGEKAEVVLPILLHGLEIENHAVKERVVSAIGKLGKSATGAVPALIKIGSHASIKALIKIGSEAAFSHLMGCLTDQSSCRDAIQEEGLSAIPLLIESIRKTNDDTRQWASLVLGTIGENAIPSLLPLLQNEDVTIRKYAIYTLGKMKKNPANAIASVEKIFYGSTNQDERRLAAYVLDMAGHDVEWFFKQTKLANPKNSLCNFNDDYLLYSSFDFYTGKCIVAFRHMNPVMGIANIIGGLVDFFSNDDNNATKQKVPDSFQEK